MRSLKIKRMEPGEEEEDRISNLPDEILTHILGYVQTMDAIRTGALSKRWKHLWLSVPYLTFDLTHIIDTSDTTKASRRLRGLKSFINGPPRLPRIRRLQPQPPPPPPVKKFSFIYGYKQPHSLHEPLRECLTSALNAGVQHLSLELPSSALKKEASGKIFSFCHTLVELKLVQLGRELDSFRKHFLYPPWNNPINLPNLKTLYLCVFTIPCRFAETLVSSCPKLESLTLLASYHRFKVLTINMNSPKLKSLVFGIDPPWDESHSHNVVIDAPLLETLHISGLLGRYSFTKPLSHVAEARLDLLQDLNYYHLQGSDLLQVLQAISGVKSLQITRYLSTALQYCIQQGSLSFPNLTRLKLKGINIMLVLGLLKHMPNLEYLNLSDNITGLEDGVRDHAAPCCLCSRMQVIEVEESRDWRSRLWLMEYFLKNGKVLKKMVIDCTRMYSQEDRFPDQDETRSFETEILMLVRGSRTCVIEFLGLMPQTLFNS